MCLPRLVIVGFVSWLIQISSFGTGEVSAQGETAPASEEQDDAVKLSLRSLFHPDEKKDFDGGLPTTHWIGATGSPSLLLVKREERWMQVNLNDGDGRLGDERPWPIVQRLAAQLETLDGIQSEQALKIASRAVTKMTSPSDSLLVKIGKALAIVSPDRPARWLTRDGAGWNNATLDPTARRVAYTHEGDLFVVDVKTGLSMRLTDDASDTLLDGILDWTYQEEIFGRGNYRGFWFSPDGQWLAMLRIDISGIEPYALSASSTDRGSGIVRRYSKAGDPIPHAKLYLWDLRQTDSGRVPTARLIEESTPERERLITGVWWDTRHQTMMYSVSDRSQTWRELRSIDAVYLVGKKNQSDLLLREQSPAWVEPPSAPGFLVDGSFLWLSEVPSGRSRVYRVSANGSIVQPVTPEDFDVGSFVVSGDGRFVLVTGDAKRETIENQVYRIVLSMDEDNAGLSSMTSVTDQSGWHDVAISPDGQWLVDRHSTADQPPNMSVVSADQRHSLPLAQSKLPIDEPIVLPQLFHITTPDGVPLPAMLIQPESATSTDRAAVVIEVYGGPRAPVVSSQWMGTKTLYRELLARKGIATLVVDNRSSAGRGIADTWSIRNRLGVVEMADLKSVVEWLVAQPWVDSERIAIRGWSYGGFMTLYAMTHSESFAAGIAGGSVTDWKEYDSIYTERYMGLPSINVDGYAASSVIGSAKDLHGRLLMVHGEVDDNVHPSNTLRMAESLQKAGRDFQMMIYPGASHAVSEPHQAWHMVLMTDRFLTESLKK